ncbi:carbohydrate binding domain-containing protein [bacterium]|nr:carbohydrate binding domain-containing protein [bacterium]
MYHRKRYMGWVGALIFCSIILGTVFCKAENQNLVENPGFEDGLHGWKTKLSGDIADRKDEFIFETTKEEAIDGKYCARIVWPKEIPCENSTLHLNQTIDEEFKKGERYRFSFHAKHTLPRYPKTSYKICRLGFKKLQGGIKNIDFRENITSSNWREYSLNFTIENDAECVYIFFFSRVNGETILIDNVKLAKIEEVEAKEKKGPIKNTYSDMQFFKSSHGSVSFKELPDKLLFANSHIGLGFYSGNYGFAQSSIYSVDKDTDFLFQDFPKDRALWQIVLRRDKGKDSGEIILDNFSPSVTSYRREINNDCSILHLYWKDLGVAGKNDALDVEVTVTLQKDNPLSFWRINIQNRNKVYGIWQVFFPVMKLASIGGTPEDDYFMFCKDRGRLIKNPYNAPNGFRHGLHVDGTFPGTLDMQFQALYDGSGTGLYLAAYDDKYYSKCFRAIQNSSDDTIEFKHGHNPPNMGYPDENYSLPYDMVIGVFSGDWYDACQLYRKWAIKQPWCRKGPLITREDIPAWYKEAPLMLRNSSHKRDPSVALNRDNFLKFLKFADTTLPSIWYAWYKDIPDMSVFSSERVNMHDGNYPKIPALPCFAEACKAISEAGGYPSAYVCVSLYDQGSNNNAPYAKWAEQYVGRDVNQELMYWPKLPTWWMCTSSEEWQNRIKDICVALIKNENVKGIYLDTLNGSGTHCFDTSHNHPHGGGNYRCLGQRKLAKDVRDAIKSINPEAFTTAENPADTFIDVIDGMLYQHTYYPGFIPVPMFGVVYNDYIPRYGRYGMLNDDGTIGGTPDSFYFRAGSLFAEGAQVGRVSIDNDSVTDPKYKEKAVFLKKIINYYKKEVGGSYLCYGQLLRPIKFLKPDPLPVVPYIYKGEEENVKAFFSGVFKSATNEDICIFIVNVSNKKVEFSFNLDCKKYNVPSNKEVKVCKVSETGDRKSLKTCGEIFEYSDTIGARDIIMLELK